MFPQKRTGEVSCAARCGAAASCEVLSVATFPTGHANCSSDDIRLGADLYALLSSGSGSY